MFPFFVIDHGIWKTGSRDNIHFTHSLICSTDVDQEPTGCQDTVGIQPDMVALSWKLHTSGEMGHGHWSHRHGSLLERAGSDQVPGRASGDGTGMCAVKQESRTGRLGGSCEGSVAPGSRVVWRCRERLQKLLDQTPRSLQGHVEEGGGASDRALGASRKGCSIHWARSCPEGEGERYVFLSVGFWAGVCIRLRVWQCVLCEYPNAVSESRACVSLC